MKSYVSGLVFLCILLFTRQETAAQQFHRIPYVVDSLLGLHTISGNILIAAEGRIVYAKAVGFTDISEATPMQRSGIFPLGGLSVPLTGYAITLLKAKGLLDFDSSLTHYIPRFPYPSITIRHLLTHTAGLPGYEDKHAFTGKLNTLPDSITTYAPSLLSAPGKAFLYSELGYQLLALLIEQVSGLSYTAFMQHYLFRPARMLAASAGKPGLPRSKRLTSGHRFDSTARTFITIPDTDAADIFEDPAVITGSAFDLFLWDRMLRTSKLPPALLTEATTPYGGQALVKTKNGKTISYGFGWSISQHDKAGKILYHIGIRPGFTHYYYRLPDRDICFIFLSNAETPMNAYLRSRIVDLLSQ